MTLGLAGLTTMAVANVNNTNTFRNQSNNPNDRVDINSDRNNRGGTEFNRNMNRSSNFNKIDSNRRVGHSNMNQDLVKEVQEKLNDRNFTTGKADGIYGPRTSAAIRDYQRSENLQVTGRLNQETLQAMGIDYDSSKHGNLNQIYSE